MKEIKFRKGVGLTITNGNLEEEVFQNALNAIFKEVNYMCNEDDNTSYVTLQADDHIIVTSCRNDFTVVALNRIKKALSFIKEGYLEVASYVSDEIDYKYKMEFFDDKITFKYIGGELYEEDKK